MVIKDKPLVNIFTYDGKYFVYDSQKNCVLMVPRDIYLDIYKILKIGFERYFFESKEKNETKIIKKLLKSGYLQISPVDKLYNDEISNVEQILANNIKHLILNVTYNCNFKCRYCSFANDNPFNRNNDAINMSWDIAKKAIDFAIAHSSETEIMEIGFYGGEPLINFKVIKETIEYCNMILTNMKFNYSLTTNLSLMNKEILDFFVSNKVDILVSLDGPQNIHDSHRFFEKDGSETYNKVIEKLNFIKENYNNYFVKHIKFNSVIMPNDNISDVEMYFKNLFPENVTTYNYADLSKTEIIYNNNYVKLKNDATKELSNGEQILLGEIKKFNILLKQDYPIGQCLPGYTKLLVDIDGELYPCEKCNTKNKNYIIGNVNKGFNFNNIKFQMNICSLMENKCKYCWAFKLCNSCSIWFDSIDDFNTKIKEIHCERVKEDLTNIMIKYLKKRGV